jgi:HK97 family phage portal protein
MGFLSSIVAPASQRMNVAFQEGVWPELFAKSKAGPAVTLDAALKVSAAFACMREISQGLAQVPFKLMQDFEKDGLRRKRVARDHQVHELISARPNDWQTSFEFMETLGLHATLGNAYVYKVMVRGAPRELIILDPCRVTAELSDRYEPVYLVTGRDGKQETLDRSRIWHVRGASWDGFLGLETLKLAREALGLSIALEDSVSSLHANGVRPTGVYSVDSTLDKKQYEQLTDWLKKQAAAGAGTPLVLDRGAKWLQQTMTSVDAQHREMRQHQIEDVCRFFGVLPTIVGYTGDKANTYASAEVMENAHKVRTMGRWFKRIQDSADINLLTDAERREGGYYTKFTTNALMAASAADRGEFYAKALGSGGSPAFMTQDEIRALEDLDPMGGEAAKLPPRAGAESSDQPSDDNQPADQRRQRLNVGRVLSSRNERRIRDADGLLNDVLAELDEPQE